MTHEKETENFICPVYDPADHDDCYECGGEEWLVNDCFEDCRCCSDPEYEHELIPCPNCNPGSRRVLPS